MELHQLLNHVYAGNFHSNNRIKKIVHVRQQRKAASVVNRHDFENAVAKIMAAVININKGLLLRHNLAINQH